MSTIPDSRRVKALREARTRMNTVREEIYAAVAGKSDAELLAPPAGGGWSAAEVLDHIGRAEGKLVKGFVALERGEPLKIPRKAWWYRVPITPVFWSIRFQAPKPVRPRPRAEIRPAEAIEKLRASRRALLEYVEATGEERFSLIVLPHFILGRFSGLTWFRFIAGHETKHLGQIRRVLGGP